jgi:Ca2+:H+ antiporter
VSYTLLVAWAAQGNSAAGHDGNAWADRPGPIAHGCSNQITLFVAPVLVLASYAVAPTPFVLSSSRAEIGSLFLKVLIGVMVSGDGRSHWYKGVQQITGYAIMALMFYFLPCATR